MGLMATLLHLKNTTDSAALRTHVQNSLHTCQSQTKSTSAQTVDGVLALLANKVEVASLMKGVEESGNSDT
jgi:hypothetical protein